MAVTSLHDIAPAQQVLENAPRGLPLPWWAKIGAKIVLSRVFPSYRTRKALGLFLHGNLDQNVARHHAFVKNVLAQHERVTGQQGRDAAGTRTGKQPGDRAVRGGGRR